jgi:hypothetical protein
LQKHNLYPVTLHSWPYLENILTPQFETALFFRELNLPHPPKMADNWGYGADNGEWKTSGRKNSVCFWEYFWWVLIEFNFLLTSQYLPTDTSLGLRLLFITKLFLNSKGATASSWSKRGAFENRNEKLFLTIFD